MSCTALSDGLVIRQIVENELPVIPDHHCAQFGASSRAKPRATVSVPSGFDIGVDRSTRTAAEMGHALRMRGRYTG
jgi:hypothetical protein